MNLNKDQTQLQMKNMTATSDTYQPRAVYVPGTFPGESWNPSSNQMTYMGNGLYTFSFTQVRPATYQYKITMGDWTENYGTSGEPDGKNISVTVKTPQDVTIYYSDYSHYSRTSCDYLFGASVTLKGTGIPDGTLLTDERLNGIYSRRIVLRAGNYPDLEIMTETTNIRLQEITLSETKEVTFYYDPVTGIHYNDASDTPVMDHMIYFDSKDPSYKSIFGAVATGQNVEFQIRTGLDAAGVRLIIKGASVSGREMDRCRKEEDHQMWKVSASFDEIGEYQYFFVISNGSSIRLYGDSDGYYGVGRPSDLADVLPYDLIVYDSTFRTPDWMKHAIVYQIFPERFMDGRIKNNTAVKSARGDLNYEYVTDWYMYPENPDQLRLHGDQYPETAYRGNGEFSDEIYGGDLAGIIDKMDYLKALGINVIYLNPVFSSISSHRYDTSDYMKIDPILGTGGDFAKLVKAAKENQMYLILDGVFNHVSDDSKYFDRYYKFLERYRTSRAKKKQIGAYPYWAYVYDQKKEKKISQQEAEITAKEHFTNEYGINDFSYTEWFQIFPDRVSINTDGEEEVDTIGMRAGKKVYGYEGWWSYSSMPVIHSTNGSEYQTGNWAKEIIGGNEKAKGKNGSVTQYWLKKGMNGWRLDVADEVSEETWRHFRSSVKALNSDHVIIGEIWTDASKYLMGDMYDSVMNYVFRSAVLTFVKGGSSQTMMHTLERIRERYPKEAYYAMMNLVASHDTSRLLSYLDGIDDDRRQTDPKYAFPTYENTSYEAKLSQYLVAFLQFTYPGAPTIYYGDEIGMVGADDPDDRRGMNWGKGDQGIVEWYALLAAIRSQYPVLQIGTIEVIETNNPAVVAFCRKLNNEQIVILANNSWEIQTMTLSRSKHRIMTDLWIDVISGKEVHTDMELIEICVPSRSGVILVDADQVKEINVAYESLRPAYDPGYVIQNARLTINHEQIHIGVGEKIQLKASGRGALRWHSSDKNIASVRKGKVTGVQIGTAQITVKQEDGQTAVCAVTVG